MSFLTYNNQYVTQNGKMATNISSSVIIDALDFNGETRVYLGGFGDLSSFDGNKRITFGLWLDANSGFVITDVIAHFVDNSSGNTVFDIGMDGSNFRFKGYRSGSWNHYYPIGSFDNQVLNCEIIKTNTSITSFKINNVSQSGTSDTVSIGALAGGWYIGYNSGIIWTTNMTVWDFKIYDLDSAGVLIHHWPGYPDGNINAAWEDQIGSRDGTVYTLHPPASTRQITIS